ncbi:MAG: hypothetical protein LBU32_33140 [Clostridiales bacterium]|jgi:hypothetical protein|nr:hypothetical protein [Clostridiales bacterium]
MERQLEGREGSGIPGEAPVAEKNRQIKALGESLKYAGHGGDMKIMLGGRLSMILEELGEIEDLRKHPTHNIKTVLLRRTAVSILCLSQRGNGRQPL